MPGWIVFPDTEIMDTVVTLVLFSPLVGLHTCLTHFSATICWNICTVDVAVSSNLNTLDPSSNSGCWLYNISKWLKSTSAFFFVKEVAQDKPQASGVLWVSFGCPYKTSQYLLLSSFSIMEDMVFCTFLSFNMQLVGNLLLVVRP